MTEMPLSKPIQAHGETLSALTFREPTGADLVKCGLPFSLAVDGTAAKVDFDTRAAAQWIAALAAIPPSSVAQLSFKDMAAAMMTVAGFFGEAIPPLSGMITLPLANGGATSPT